jgi:hypothetical protein
LVPPRAGLSSGSTYNEEQIYGLSTRVTEA